GDEQDDPADVGGEVADPQPRRLELVRHVVPAFLRIGPLGADAHDDPARERDREERQSGKAAKSAARFAPADQPRTRGGDEAAEEDHRAGHVNEDREIPAVWTNCGEHGHAPGLKIMSRTRRTKTARVARWRTAPVGARSRVITSCSDASPCLSASSCTAV